MNIRKFIVGAALCAAAGLWVGGAFAAADVAAADGWRFCEPDYAVLVPDASLWGNDNHHKVVNEHFHVLESPKSGDLLAFWTQESFDGSDDMHISFARSRDGGKTWTAPRIFRGSPKPGSGVANAVWQLPMFTKSGRLYCFWNEREKPGKGQGVGYMKGAYSDDDGETWSEPKVVWQPRQWCSWERPCRADGTGPISKRRGNDDDYLSWSALGVLEQYRCYVPIDASAAKLLRTYAAFWRETGDALALEKARTLADAIVNEQLDNGRIPTFWNDFARKEPKGDWLNCLIASAMALEDFARLLNRTEML